MLEEIDKTSKVPDEWTSTSFVDLLRKKLQAASDLLAPMLGPIVENVEAQAAGASPEASSGASPGVSPETPGVCRNDPFKAFNQCGLYDGPGNATEAPSPAPESPSPAPESPSPAPSSEAPDKGFLATASETFANAPANVFRYLAPKTYQKMTEYADNMEPDVIEADRPFSPPHVDDAAAVEGLIRKAEKEGNPLTPEDIAELKAATAAPTPHSWMLGWFSDTFDALATRLLFEYLLNLLGALACFLARELWAAGARRGSR